MSIFTDISPVSWALFFLINGIILFSSYCLSSYLTSSNQFSGTVIGTILIYIAQITLSVLFLGVILQWLNAESLLILNTLLSTGIIFRYWRVRKPFSEKIHAGFSALVREGGAWTYIFMFLLVVQLLFSLFNVVIEPVHLSDSFSYRTPPAVMWYQAGMIPPVLDVPVNEMNGRSLEIAVLMLWYFIFLKDSVLVNIPQYISAVLLLFTVYAIARQCSVSRVWSFNAAILCFFMPSVIIQSTATQDHLSLNVTFLTALYFLRDYFLSKRLSSILLLGVSVGLMFAFKNNAVVYMPALLGASIYFLWTQRFSVRAGEYKQLFRYCLAALIIACCIGGYWTARNLIIFGDPFGMTFAKFNQVNDVYNIVVNKGESFHKANIVIDKDESLQKSDIAVNKDEHVVGNKIELPNVFSEFFRGNNFIGNIRDFFPTVLDSQNAKFSGTMYKVSGFGPQFFTFGLISMIWLTVSVFRKSWRLPGTFYAVCGAGLLLIYFFVMHNIYAYRNFIFFAILMLIFYASIASSSRDYKRTGHVLHLLMLVCVVWTMYIVSPPVYANPNILKEFVSLSRHYQTAGRYFLQFKGNPKILRELSELPEDASMAYITPGSRNTWIYTNYDVHWKRHIQYIPLLDKYMHCNRSFCRPTDELKALLRKEKITLVNMCIADSCPVIKDPDFFVIGRGLHYFEAAGS